MSLHAFTTSPTSPKIKKLHKKLFHFSNQLNINTLNITSIYGYLLQSKYKHLI